MDLKLNDVSRLLKVDERAIKEMAKRGRIPSYEMNGQLRFSREEIEAWVMSQERGLPGGQTGVHQFNLYRAVHRGGVLTVPGTTKEEVIRTAMADVAHRFDLDGAVLTDLLLDRERLMPTGLGEGIAVPHARDFLLTTPFDLVTVVFPEAPLEYGALDGKPVHTLVFLFASSDARHLNLLAKIAHLAANTRAQSILQRRPSQKELLAYLKEWEQSLSPALIA